MKEFRPLYGFCEICGAEKAVSNTNNWNSENYCHKCYEVTQTITCFWIISGRANITRTDIKELKSSSYNAFRKFIMRTKCKNCQHRIACLTLPVNNDTFELFEEVLWK